MRGLQALARARQALRHPGIHCTVRLAAVPGLTVLPSTPPLPPSGRGLHHVQGAGRMMAECRLRGDCSQFDSQSSTTRKAASTFSLIVQAPAMPCTNYEIQRSVRLATAPSLPLQRFYPLGVVTVTTDFPSRLANHKL